MDEPMNQITERQAACLRLVAQNLSSKEIAARTGLTWQTVDTYLKQANARLGVANRREAARLYVSWELSRLSGSPPEAVVPTLAAGDEESTGKREGRGWPRLPPVGGSVNDLAWDEKILRAVQVAAVSVALMVAVTLAIAGLLYTVR